MSRIQGVGCCLILEHWSQCNLVLQAGSLFLENLPLPLHSNHHITAFQKTALMKDKAEEILGLHSNFCATETKHGIKKYLLIGKATLHTSSPVLIDSLV